MKGGRAGAPLTGRLWSENWSIQSACRSGSPLPTLHPAGGHYAAWEAVRRACACRLGLWGCALVGARFALQGASKGRRGGASQTGQSCRRRLGPDTTGLPVRLPPPPAPERLIFGNASWREASFRAPWSEGGGGEEPLRLADCGCKLVVTISLSVRLTPLAWEAATMCRACAWRLDLWACPWWELELDAPWSAGGKRKSLSDRPVAKFSLFHRHDQPVGQAQPLPPCTQAAGAKCQRRNTTCVPSGRPRALNPKPSFLAKP